jgi:3'-phosphoadenosine 5'-phosphosulfate sulfotransferase (PAPS reductase)/FAD synthetase
VARLVVVSISGGKDSTATAIRAIKRVGRANVHLVMADTGNEHDLTMRYALDYLPGALGLPVTVVRANFSERIARKRIYVETQWPKDGVPAKIVERALSVLHPTGNPFLDLCLWKGRFPSRKAQFCTQELKRFPLDKYLLDRMVEGHDVESWRGIRRDESTARKDAVTRELVAEDFWIVHPIANWTAQQVVDYVRRHGINLNPLYRNGMRRVGCMPCINCGKDELLAIGQRYPQYIDVIREWERLVSLAAKRGWTTFFTTSAKISSVARPGWKYEHRVDPLTNQPVDEWIEPDESIYARNNVDARVRWSQTSRGGRQTDPARLLPVLGCSSQYGLCE